MCCLLFYVTGCHTRNQNEIFVTYKTSIIEEQKITMALAQTRKAKELVHSGDLILRTGKDFTSELMRDLSQNDKTYSHCGIASWENDTLFVYHAIGGQWNPDQKIRRDPFELFSNPFENRGFGIFRYNFNAMQEKNIINMMHHFFNLGIRFDMQFDLSTDNRMYCSELIFKTIEKATDDSAKLSTTTLDHLRFVAIDNLFLNPYCREIKRISFAKQ